MRVFISGPISGLPEEVYTANFQQAAGVLKGYGLEPVSPIEITDHLPEGTAWEVYLKLCLSWLLGCDAIYMMEGWENSKGAKIEYHLAQSLGLITMHENKV